MLLLVLAITAEVIGTAGLKASGGFGRLGPSMLAVVGYCAAFYFLSLSLKQLPLGIAYVIWPGPDTVGSVLIGVLIWWEALGTARLAGIALILAGVVVLNVFAGNRAA